MPGTPDRRPGVLDEEAIILEDTVAPTTEREVRYTSGAFQMQDSIGIFDPRTGGAPFAIDDVMTFRSDAQVAVFRSTGNIATVR